MRRSTIRGRDAAGLFGNDGFKMPEPGSGEAVLPPKKRQSLALDPLEKDEPRHYGTLVILIGDPSNRQLLMLEPMDKESRGKLYLPQVKTGEYDQQAMLGLITREVQNALGVELGEIETVFHEAEDPEHTHTLFLTIDAAGMIPISQIVSMSGYDFRVVSRWLAPGLQNKLVPYQLPYLKASMTYLATDPEFFRLYGDLVRTLSS